MVGGSRRAGVGFGRLGSSGTAAIAVAVALAAGFRYLEVLDFMDFRELPRRTSLRC